MFRRFVRSLALLSSLSILLPLQAAEPEEPLLPLKKIPAAELAPAPRLVDAKKPYDVIAVAPLDGARPAGEKVGVGFFNHSERDILLEIDHRTVKLGSRHYVQIKLPREFGWREKEGELQKMKVPADAEGMEIVFRR